MQTPQTSDTGSQAKEAVQQVAGQAQERAREAGWQARERAREQVDQRSTQAGERVDSTASDIRSVAVQLRGQGKDQPARLAEQAADHAERLGGYLKRADADGLLRDVEDFGRRQPMAVVLGGLALGFAASRFLKASSARRSDEGRGGGRVSSRAVGELAPPAIPPAAPAPAPPARLSADPAVGRFERPDVPATAPGGAL